MAKHPVICIAREFGSGGHNIGEVLAKECGLSFYDKELLKEAADKTGILHELFEKADEKSAGSVAAPEHGSSTPTKKASFEDYLAYNPGDAIQNAIGDVIRDVAEKGPCVIIGRCSDYVLRGRENMLSIFIHAGLDKRIQRIARMHNLDEDKARNLIRKTDTSRANYYNHFTSRNWGAANNYHLCLDAGALDPEICVKAIRAVAGI